VRLLVTEDEREADDLAGLLHRLNQERQLVEAGIVAEAMQAAESAPPGPLVLASRGWHQGVIGIVAARLVERFHRPAILIALNGDGLGKGSARSITGVNIFEAIAQCREFLDAFGGHAAAAGLTIREERIPAFRARLSDVLRGPLSSPAARPRLFCDADVAPRACVPSAARELERLGPFGAGNPEPTLVVRNLRIVSARLVGAKHLKLAVADRNGHRLDAIGFNMGTLESRGLSPSDPIDVACALEINVWNGTERAQLRLKDLRAGAH